MALVLGVACVAAWAPVASAQGASAQGYEVKAGGIPLFPRPDDATLLAGDATVDDPPSTAVTLPFRFVYFGDAYTELRISADGWVRPGGAEPPAATAGKRGDGAIMVTATGTGVRVYTWVTGAAPQRAFVVSWEQGGSRTGAQEVAQVHLREGPGRVAFSSSALRPAGEPLRRGLDEPSGEREANAPDTGPPGCVFEPRTVLFNPAGIGTEGEPVAWLNVRRESTIPDGCTKRCTYLARGRGYFHVPDRALWVRHATMGRRKRPATVLSGLLAEDRKTFGGDKGDAGRWVRQVLDGKMIFLPADGGPPRRIWFRIIEYFSLDELGTTAADHHIWNLRWVLSNTLAAGDAREIDGYFAWKAMARARLTVGKLFRAGERDNAGRQYNSGRKHEYLLWSARLKDGARGLLTPRGAAPETWVRFSLQEDDARIAQHAETADLRFVQDPNYVDGHYEYVIRALDNEFGWITGRTVPPPPIRDEPFDEDPGRTNAPVTGR